MCADSSPTVIDCTFWNNSVEVSGGAVRCTRSSPAFINCTMVGNYAPQDGSGVFSEDQSSPTLDNTIIAFNGDGDAFLCLVNSGATLTCCDVYGNVGGDWGECIQDQFLLDGNIWEDPLFCDRDTGNLRLLEGSPCAPFSPPNPECDLIGAWPVGCASGLDEQEIHPVAMFVSPSTPNPFEHSTRLSYAIPESGTIHPIGLRVYDVSGRLVRSLVSDPQPAGIHTVSWDGANEVGEVVANGLYFFRLTWNGHGETRSVMLLH